MVVDALGHERVEIALVANRPERLLFVEVEILTLIFDFESRGDLPFVKWANPKGVLRTFFTAASRHRATISI